MPLLDTDVLVDVLRNYPPAIHWLTSLGGEPVVISGYAALELLQGCRDKVEHDKVERLFNRCQIAWLSEQDCATALAWFSQNHLASGIGILDLLIGQTSLTLKMPLHTFNTKHYRALPGIEMREPYQRGPIGAPP